MIVPSTHECSATKNTFDPVDLLGFTPAVTLADITFVSSVGVNSATMVPVDEPIEVVAARILTEQLPTRDVTVDVIRRVLLPGR